MNVFVRVESSSELHIPFVHILRSLAEWQSLVGEDSERQLQITYSRESGLDVSRPKHGKVWVYHFIFLTN